MTRNKNNIVKLDIGGVVFKTTKSTLKKFDGMFKTMMETNIPVTRTKFGAIFIDRDSKHFRDGYVELPNSEREIREIMMEAQYYLLNNLVEMCHMELEKICDNEDSTSFFDYSDDDIVTVNVSGKVFQTTRATLTKYDGLFKEIFASEIEYTKDNTGAIFIDRPAKHFELILNYMRDGQVRFPKSEDEILEISKEAQFYGLGDLSDMCNAKISESGANEQLSKLYNLLPDDIVKLNIGGTTFQTLESTLKGRLQEEINKPAIKDESGAIFIDRDPQYFRLILNFMRDGQVKLPVSKEDVEDICVEAEYYLSNGLVDMCHKKIAEMMVSLRVIDSNVSYFKIIHRKSGKVFQTTKSTLTKFDGMFKVMMKTDIPVSKDETGAIFIDRNSHHFRLILNFMRDGDVELPNSEEKIKEIHKEAHYYLLDGLVKLCEEKLEPVENSIKMKFVEKDSELLEILQKATKLTLRTSSPVHHPIILKCEFHITKDESGAIFIDRDPKYFLLILNFIRDGRVKLPESPKEVEKLCVEAEYYLLTGLVELCSANITTDIVKLNVGGTVFQTTTTTLTRKDSLLKRLINDESMIVRDATGCIFIDRVPKHFRLILNFLSDDDVAIPKSEDDRQQISMEAVSYSLPDLADMCNVTTLSADVRSHLHIIESDSQMLQIIADMGYKPILIIFYLIDNDGQICDHPHFNIKSFISRHKRIFDIYFRTFNKITDTEGNQSPYTYCIYHKFSKQNFCGFLDKIESGINSYNFAASKNRGNRL